MTMTEKTALIYARVSSVKQAEEGLPIESQIEQAKGKAAALSARVIKVFKDEGISGRTSKRPAFQDAILMCASRKIDYFIVWSTSRFARNKLDAASYKKILAGYGTRVVYVSVDLDSQTDEGWFSESIMEIVDEHYSRQIAKDTKRSMMKNAADGFFNGGKVPYGYKTIDHGRRKKLLPSPIEALVVKGMFASCLAGSGSKEIAMRLNAEGVSHRGSKWRKNSILFILKNPVYTGNLVFNRTCGKGRVARPPEEWVKVSSHDALVSEKDFKAVQNLLADRAPISRTGSPHSTFAFTGLLRCACGESMMIETATGRSRTYSYYNCRAALKGYGCKNRRVPAEEFDAWMINSILDRIFTPQQIASLINDVRELSSEWYRERDERVAALADEISGIDRRLNNLYNLLELHGPDTPNLGDLTTRLRGLKDRRKSLESEIRDLEAQEAPRVAISDDEVRDAVEFLRSVIIDADRKKVRLFLSTFVESMTIDERSITVNYSKDKLIETAGGRREAAPATVHSRSDRWLPVLALLRTATVRIDLPARLARAA